MLNLKKRAVITLFITMFTVGNITLNSVQAHAKTEPTVDKDMKTYSSNSLVYDGDNHMKVVANAKFIDDPNNNNKILFLSTDGSFIKSNLHNVAGYDFARMFWSSKYGCSIEVEDNDNLYRRAKIISNLPTNTVKTSNVSNTIGYSVGGNVRCEGKTPSGSVNAGYSYTQSINYQQPNFITINTDSSDNKVKWDVDFSATDDCYDKDSYNISYGNQMFMKSRLYNEGSKNLTSIDKLPTLVSGGFSPDFLVALDAPKDKKQSIVKINFTRYMDQYCLDWSGFNWYGSNFSVGECSTSSRFLIDWQNHTISALYK